MDDSGYRHLGGVLTSCIHRLGARIYYADTDSSGLVYHARYLEFFERGRIEYFRHVSEPRQRRLISTRAGRRVRAAVSTASVCR